MPSDFGASRVADGAILLARVLLMLLFVIFGFEKLAGFAATETYFAHIGLPAPALATAIAVVMEFFVGIALILGVATRPLALLLALYTLATAFAGHPFWEMAGAARMGAEINFLKNISIIGGLLLLYVTGPGRYAVGRRV